AGDTAGSLGSLAADGDDTGLNTLVAVLLDFVDKGADDVSVVGSGQAQVAGDGDDHTMLDRPLGEQLEFAFVGGNLAQAGQDNAGQVGVSARLLHGLLGAAQLAGSHQL